MKESFLNNFFQQRNNFIVVLLVALNLAIGFSVGTWLYHHNQKECVDKYHFLNPVFACLEKITVDKRAYSELKLNLVSFIDKEIKVGNAEEVGLFFRDLEAGPTLGINDRLDFIPASLLKLVHALTIFRFAEEENLPNIFSQKLNYKNDPYMNMQEFPPQEIIKKDVLYTVNELVERTLQHSDNLADELLLEYIKFLDPNNDLISETYRDLGILSTYSLNNTSVSVKGYASIFRMLYNSSFLDKYNSEKLLGILSKNSFKNGLRAGLPDGIVVANKFGERTLTSTNEKQLHDCGIVYYPTNPYLLCVMTKGKDFKNLEKIISHISREVYKEFDSRRIK